MGTETDYAEELNSFGGYTEPDYGMYQVKCA